MNTRVKQPKPIYYWVHFVATMRWNEAGKDEVGRLEDALGLPCQFPIERIDQVEEMAGACAHFAAATRKPPEGAKVTSRILQFQRLEEPAEGKYEYWVHFRAAVHEQKKIVEEGLLVTTQHTISTFEHLNEVSYICAQYVIADRKLEPNTDMHMSIFSFNNLNASRIVLLH